MLDLCNRLLPFLRNNISGLLLKRADVLVFHVAICVKLAGAHGLPDAAHVLRLLREVPKWQSHTAAVRAAELLQAVVEEWVEEGGVLATCGKGARAAASSLGEAG